jgi:hypothetical protein
MLDREVPTISQQRGFAVALLAWAASRGEAARTRPPYPSNSLITLVARQPRLFAVGALLPG